MGMFDTVVIEGLKLPGLPKEVKGFLKGNNASIPNDFQTKDLDNALLTFKIKENGQVYESYLKPTGKKVERRPWWSLVDNRSFVERLYFKFTTKEDTKPDNKVDELVTAFKKSKLTATFNAGCYSEVGGRYLDLDFQFICNDGIVNKVKLLNYSIESNEDSNKRHQRDSEFKTKVDLQIKERKEFQSQWYYPVLKEIYNPIVFFGRKALQSIANKLYLLSNRWHGV